MDYSPSVKKVSLDIAPPRSLIPESSVMLEQLEEAQRRERVQTAKLQHQLQRYRQLEARLEKLSQKIVEGEYDVASDLKQALEFERAQGERLRSRLDSLDEAIETLTVENQAAQIRVAELEEENTELMRLLRLREEWLDQSRSKLEAYQKEVEGSQEEARERRHRMSNLQEDKRRLERCLEQAVKTRERAVLENEYLKHALFDQRKKLLKVYMEFGREPSPEELEEEHGFLM